MTDKHPVHTFHDRATVMPMACGGCGHGSFCMGKFAGGLAVMCQKCGSISTLTVDKPSIRIDWDSATHLGCITTMNPTSI